MATTAVSPPPCPTSPRLTPREPPSLERSGLARHRAGSTASRSSAAGRRAKRCAPTRQGSRPQAPQTASSDSADDPAAGSSGGVSASSLSAATTTFSDVNRILCANPNLFQSHGAVIKLSATLEKFLDANRIASASPNLQTGVLDRLDRVISLCYDLNELSLRAATETTVWPGQQPH